MWSRLLKFPLLTQSALSCINTRRQVLKKNCFSAWESMLNMGLISKVDMVCLSPMGYGVLLTF